MIEVWIALGFNCMIVLHGMEKHQHRGSAGETMPLYVCQEFDRIMLSLFAEHAAIFGSRYDPCEADNRGRLAWIH
jgi:hypothetical protein